MECYSIILKNNDELLNRRLEQLKERDFNLRKKEFLLSKIKSNDFKANPNFILNQEDKRELDKNFEGNKINDKNINEGKKLINNLKILYLNRIYF